MYSNNLLTSSKTHYDPFGMLLVGRNWEGGSEYRFGFNGKESDKETYGDGNIYDYGFRIYNPRLGKFLSVDPLNKFYPMLTPYQFTSNRPIDGVDLDGLEYLSNEDARFKYINGLTVIDLENNGDIVKSKIESAQNSNFDNRSLTQIDNVGTFGLATFEINPADFDGNWGIFDEPFLKWTANEMSTLKPPFYSQIFTISSHHPFTVPPQHKGQFKKGVIPMLEVVGYADYALKQFFAEAKKQPWYNNTLFILTADHPGPPLPEHEFYQEQVGSHSTWMLIYKPNGQFQGVNDKVTQQTDIPATVLDYIGYTGKFMAYGKSVFDTTEARFVYNYHSSDYMIITDDFALQFDGSKSIGLYQYKMDSSLNDNLIFEYPNITATMEEKLKAIIQTHHEAMVRNKLMPE